MPKTLSVALITLNEAANLPRTLWPVCAGRNEIVVVDSGSTDATLEIARSAGARVFEEPGKASPRRKTPPSPTPPATGFSRSTPTKNSARSWPQEIQALLAGEPAFGAYRIPRLNHFLGRPLRHGGYWPDPKLRLFRRGAARFADRPVHEIHAMPTGPVGQLRRHLSSTTAIPRSTTISST